MAERDIAQHQFAADRLRAHRWFGKFQRQPLGILEYGTGALHGTAFHGREQSPTSERMPPERLFHAYTNAGYRLLDGQWAVQGVMEWNRDRRVRNRRRTVQRRRAARMTTIADAGYDVTVQ